jgi:heme/copper-type cytochrome/quinol oxidase subunit 2
MSKAWLSNKIKSIETWASESDERVQLLMLLIWIALGVIVLIVVVIVALVMLPPEAWSF